MLNKKEYLMMKKTSIYLLVASLATCMLTSCTTVKVESWTNPEFKQRPIGKTVILAVTKDTADRHQYEDLFAQRLNEIGEVAATSYSLLPQDTKLSKSELKNALKSVPADSILLTHLADAKERTKYVAPSSYGGGGYYGHYGHSYSHMYSPGYTQNYTEFYLEMTLYDVATEKLVWSGKSVVTDYASSKKNMKLLVNSIIKDLTNQGMIVE